jgi:hypothetical protein
MTHDDERIFFWIRVCVAVAVIADVTLLCCYAKALVGLAERFK